MTEREALVRRICENPADDTVRLVYADWLADQDDKFSRDQSLWFRAGVKGNSWDNPRTDFNLRAGMFLTSDCPTDAHWRGKCVIRRGMIEQAELPLKEFMTIAKRLFYLQPVTSVILTDRWPRQAGPATFQWFCRSDLNCPAEQFGIPPEFRHFMPNERQKKTNSRTRLADGVRVFSFRKGNIAMSALNQCAVDYGRWLCGLPRLYTTKEAP